MICCKSLVLLLTSCNSILGLLSVLLFFMVNSLSLAENGYLFAYKAVNVMLLMTILEWIWGMVVCNIRRSVR